MQETNGHARKERYFQKFENWVSFLTLIAVVIYTGIQIYQTSLFYRNYIISERPSISISAAPGGTNIDSTNNNAITGITFIISLTNSGNTGTKNLKFFIKCAVAAEDLKDSWSILYQGTEPEHFPQFIGAHASSSSRCGFSINQLQDMASHKLFGYIMADISYCDRLDDNIIHKTQATFKISRVTIHIVMQGEPSQQNGIEVQLETRGQHNCADEECDSLK